MHQKWSIVLPLNIDYLVTITYVKGCNISQQVNSQLSKLGKYKVVSDFDQGPDCDG